MTTCAVSRSYCFLFDWDTRKAGAMRRASSQGIMRMPSGRTSDMWSRVRSAVVPASVATATLDEAGNLNPANTTSISFQAILRNADLIEARLAILAEGENPLGFESTGQDCSDALREQAFIEECQLIIAKEAFPASTGPAGFREVLWVGRASNQIAARLKRRFKGMEQEIEQQVAMDLRKHMTSELDELRQRVFAAEKAAQSAAATQQSSVEQIRRLEDELASYKTQLSTQAEELLQAKIEAEKVTRGQSNDQEVYLRMKREKAAAEATAGELATTVSDLRFFLQMRAV